MVQVVSPTIPVEMRGATMLVISGLFALVAVGCGSGSHPGSSAPAATTASSSTTKQGTSQGVAVLSAEAQSAATGDIPDNQVFLTFTNPAAGYTVSYPEGWARKGDGRNVTFSDKNNIVQVVVVPGAAPTVARVFSPS